METLIKAALESDPNALNQVTNELKTFREFASLKTVSLQTLDSLQALRTIPAIQVNENSTKLGLQDSIKYFMNDLSRIIQQTYIPTDQDCVYSRSPTTDISENKFFIPGKGSFSIIDVGGQQSLRKSWVPYFEDKSAGIIFVAALSSFNQVLQEDNEKNRMVDAIELFKSIVNHTLLKSKSVILLLNKLDLFEEKITKVAVSDYFPDFNTTLEHQTAKDARIFFLQKFLATGDLDDRCFFHFTTNTDKNLTEFIIRAVIDSIVKANLNSNGLA